MTYRNIIPYLKVLSYWNLNIILYRQLLKKDELKVLSYWNLNENLENRIKNATNLKYYHIGI